MSNFTKVLFPCKAIASIMAEPKNFKTNQERYEAAVEALEKKEDVYHRNKGKKWEDDQKRLAAIKDLSAAVDVLEPMRGNLSLPPGCKSFLIKKYITEKYNRIQEIDDFSMVKGITMEDTSIQLYNEKNGTNHVKNKKKIENDHLTGIPDIFEGESIYEAEQVIDIKTPYDIFSFLKSVEEPLTNAHYWQIQGYMAITNAKTGIIAFCLTNTPTWMGDDEKRKLRAKWMGHPQFDKLIKIGEQRIDRNMNYDDIPVKEKVISVKVDRDEAAIDKIYQKVEMCRQFLSEFEENHLHFCQKHRKSILLSNDED
jgi:hypothetical protein